MEIYIQPSSPALPEKAVAWVADNFADWLTPHGQQADAAMMWREEAGSHSTPLYSRPDNSLVKALEGLLEWFDATEGERGSITMARWNAARAALAHRSGV